MSGNRAVTERIKPVFMGTENENQNRHLNDLKIKTPKWGTPTIIFIQDGTEVFGHQGYMTPKEFYKALGIFLLLPMRLKTGSEQAKKDSIR